MRIDSVTNTVLEREKKHSHIQLYRRKVIKIECRKAYVQHGEIRSRGTGALQPKPFISAGGA